MDIEKAKLAINSLNNYISILSEHAHEGIKPRWRDAYIQELIHMRERSYDIERSLTDE